MSINQEVELLRRIPLFAKIDPAKLRLLAFASERISYQAGDELFHQGDPADAAYIIMDGNVDVTVDIPSGRLTVAKLGRDEIVGDIGIICDVPRTATVTADDPTVVLRVTPLPKRDQPNPMFSLRMRGTSFDHYDGRRWTPDAAARGNRAGQRRCDVA